MKLSVYTPNRNIWNQFDRSCLEFTTAFCETVRMITQSIRQSRLVQRSPIFYGWVVWFVATVGLIATSPGQSFSVSLFIDHYILDFGINRTEVSALYGIGTFTAAMSLTWVGKRIDLRGNRFMSIVIAGLFGLALIACSLVMNPLTMLISFIAIRGLGQGSMGLVSTTSIAQWFQQRRGRVIGLSMVAFAIFQRFYLPILQDIINTHGWQTAWIILGLTMLVVVLPLLGIFLRDRPEDFGLLPDGKVIDADDNDEEVIIEDNWSLSEVIRTPIFWVFLTGRFLGGAFGTALIFHQISLFENLGHTAETATATYGQIVLISAGFTLFSGWLLDRLKPGYVISAQMLGLIIACGLAIIMTNEWMILAYSVGFGFFMGMGSVFDGTVWVNLFGRLHQGAIRGFVATVLVIGTSVGPSILAVSYDTVGNYAPSLLLAMLMCGLIMVLALLVKPPQRRKIG